jgi:hypothetical protein
MSPSTDRRPVIGDRYKHKASGERFYVVKAYHGGLYWLENRDEEPVVHIADVDGLRRGYELITGDQRG